MAASKEYLDFVLEQLSGLEGVRTRAMMGEYLLYCRGQVIGGVYDDRLLLKPTPGALRLLEEEGREPQFDLPYPGAKELLVADVDDGELCRRLAAMIADELTAPKKRG
ncbi:MAG: TfoX/Sxy family protein [Oscillospiraceae bacterium]|nr:TfoX/Sxy family protein [Oscillospiraceae bacterium]